jgi:hypothetical protein
MNTNLTTVLPPEAQQLVSGGVPVLFAIAIPLVLRAILRRRDSLVVPGATGFAKGLFYGCLLIISIESSVVVTLICTGNIIIPPGVLERMQAIMMAAWASNGTAETPAPPIASPAHTIELTAMILLGTLMGFVVAILTKGHAKVQKT